LSTDVTGRWVAKQGGLDAHLEFDVRMYVLYIPAVSADIDNPGYLGSKPARHPTLVCCDWNPMTVIQPPPYRSSLHSDLHKSISAEQACDCSPITNLVDAGLISVPFWRDRIEYTKSDPMVLPSSALGQSPESETLRPHLL
jgi:hypothetical protein